jgi:hypothetical protein
MYFAHLVRGAAGELRSVMSARTRTHRQFRDVLVIVGIATAGIDLLCAGLALVFERHAPHTQITNVGDALFWTSTQLLTVSSSLQNPISTPGKILDVVMELYAVTVIATLAGAAGTFMLRRARETERHRPAGARE